jgi:hypothetical protein
MMKIKNHPGDNQDGHIMRKQKNSYQLLSLNPIV